MKGPIAKAADAFLWVWTLWLAGRRRVAALRPVAASKGVATDRRSWLLACVALGAGVPAAAAPGVYETDLDPGVGFNLISWWDGTQGSDWVAAVNKLYDNGFRHVSMSPLRFANLSTGQLLSDAQATQGSPLSSLVAGLQRATDLGMHVTLNPFIELYDPSDNSYFADVPGAGGCTWRGCWNPGGAVRDTFFADYTDYVEEIATLAEQYGADRLSVGTELRQMVGNTSNIGRWSGVLDAADAAYSGDIGYAANWDHWAFGPGSGAGVTALFDHPAVDWVGVDSYFTNLVGQSAADASGSYPNQAFIDQVEAAWNNLLDTNLLPYAAARNGGEGLPLVFTEIGHLPRNRTALDPQQQAQSSTQPIDTAEQRMAFEGFFNAIDGRQGLIPEITIWQFNMAGGTSDWSIDPALPQFGGAYRQNNDLAQWLVDFVGTATLGGPQASGDFNADGLVDAADYTVWRDAEGGSLTAADANGDGLVDGGDYTIWRNNYGSSLASGAVPEPSAGAIALLAGAAFFFCRHPS